MGKEYKPSSTEYDLVGSTGILLFFLLIAMSIRAVYQSKTLILKKKATRTFFIFLILMAIFELPRYFAIASTHKYNSTGAYCMHILASSLFFGCFSIVCYQWSGLLQLGPYVKPFFSVNGLLVSNIIFCTSDFLALIFCAVSTNLQQYFESINFATYVFVDAFKNLVYSTLLSYYGISLVSRFYRYSSIEINGGAKTSVFSTALSRITLVLVISTLCFFTRIMMLIVKLIAMQTDHIVTNPQFTLFGIWWFTFSDFIPRCIPSFAFLYLMQTKRYSIKREMSDGKLIQAKHTSSSAQNEDAKRLGNFKNYEIEFTDEYEHVYTEDEDEDDDVYDPDESSEATTEIALGLALEEASNHRHQKNPSQSQEQPQQLADIIQFNSPSFDFDSAKSFFASFITKSTVNSSSIDQDSKGSPSTRVIV